MYLITIETLQVIFQIGYNLIICCCFFFNDQINKIMRAGANILSPISVNQKYPPGTVVDYAYSVFYQVSSYNPTEL